MKIRGVVNQRGQVTIPKRLRARLGLAPGTVLEFEEENGKLVASRAVLVDPVRVLIGLGDTGGLDTDAWLAESRGPAWSPKLDKR